MALCAIMMFAVFNTKAVYADKYVLNWAEFDPASIKKYGTDELIPLFYESITVELKTAGILDANNSLIGIEIETIKIVPPSSVSSLNSVSDSLTAVANDGLTTSSPPPLRKPMPRGTGFR